ncbi:LysR substrate-binding domain-containing protein [Rubrivirga sp. S365]|uniref:LysR substrate-binding domain-containing protein n=1 Tax=Rubrivirga sp. S365 TaxID=3076080 RepID=UPI0028CA7ECF|nr:LysR substrate-binding domain-containing protein [Rubrivirga sp. S365]MDT7858177.1 LysR substrate-binding domain-containing protein [Rubrivirga sp. S365]
MELRHLRSFIAAAEELHFGRAAQRVFVSQPALSRQIQALEGEVGTPLFDRSGRVVRLTSAGEALLERARYADRAVDDALDAARRAGRGETGRVVVGYTDSALHGPLAPAIAAFRIERPGVGVVLLETASADQPDALRSGRIDVAFAAAEPGEVEGQDSAVLYRVDSFVAVPHSHSLATRSGPTGHTEGPVPLADLAGEPFVMPSLARDPILYDGIVRACGQAGFAPRIAQEASGAFTMLSLVAAGVGVAVLPGTVAGSFSRDGVGLRELSGGFTRLEMRMSWTPDATSPALRTFVDAVVAAC